MVEELSEVIRDAHDNFENGRLKDAYNHYKTIADNYFERQDIRNGLYFTYRAVLCIDDEMNYFRDLLKMGAFLVKYGLFSTNSKIKSTKDPRKQLRLLSIQDKIVQDLSLKDMETELVDSQIKSLKIILLEHDLSLDDKIQYSVQLVGILEEKNELMVDIYRSYLLLSEKYDEDEIGIYQKLHCLKQALIYAPEGTERILSDRIELLEKEIS